MMTNQYTAKKKSLTIHTDWFVILLALLKLRPDTSRNSFLLASFTSRSLPTTSSIDLKFKYKKMGWKTNVGREYCSDYIEHYLILFSSTEHPQNKNSILNLEKENNFIFSTSALIPRFIMIIDYGNSLFSRRSISLIRSLSTW